VVCLICHSLYEPGLVVGEPAGIGHWSPVRGGHLGPIRQIFLVEKPQLAGRLQGAELCLQRTNFPDRLVAKLLLRHERAGVFRAPLCGPDIGFDQAGIGVRVRQSLMATSEESTGVPAS
jgi:hypothetical protein